MDPQIAKWLEPLDGKLLSVEVTELPRFFLRVSKRQTELLWETNERPDGTIRTGLFAAVRANTQGNGHLFDDDSICEILGDPDTIRVIRIFFSKFEPDWEEGLSRFLGDAMAHKAGQSIRVGAKWAKNARRSATQNLSEYLQEERKVLTTRPRIERHLGEVARLQHAVDALERRLTSLGRLAE